jgi:hypothetical protein
MAKEARQPTPYLVPLAEMVGAREKERREKAKAREAAAVEVAPQTVAIVQPAAATLTLPEQAVEDVARVAPRLFVAMVEERKGLLDALRESGVSSATFFTALDASQELRGWYRGVKGAQAVMDVEQIDNVLSVMDDDADDETIGSVQRTAKMTVARTKLEQARWAAQRLLPALFGEKTQTDVSGKVEIIVRRETKKAKKDGAE